MAKVPLRKKSKATKPKLKSPLPVIIFCPSASGSSLLAHSCQLCGVEFIGHNDEIHLERVDIAEMLNKDNLKGIEDALESMVGLAEMKKLPAFGIKLTCFGIDKWQALKPYFDEYWPGAVKFSTFRHPYGYYKSQCAKKPPRSPDPSIDQIMANYLGFFNTWEVLYHDEGFKLIEFPYAWDSGLLKAVLIDYQLNWNNDVLDYYFKSENANHVSIQEMETFADRFKRVAIKYNRLIGMVK